MSYLTQTAIAKTSYRRAGEHQSDQSHKKTVTSFKKNGAQVVQNVSKG